MKIKNWDKRNVEYTNAKELVVRQKFKKFDSVTDLDGTKFIIDSFTIRNGRTDEVWHYVLLCNLTAGVPSGTPVLNVYNEDMFLVFSFNYGSVPEIPPCMTYAVVEDELLICVTGLPSVWGLVGGGLRLATLSDPTNQNTSSIATFPSGITIGWAGRAVVADGGALYFSDALDPRAFTGANFINPPGEYIFDMHVNSGGALIIVTSNGVYMLPEEASFSGIGGVVMPVWTKLTDYSAVGYRKSISYKGRVYGLTARGFQLIDDKSSEEVQISEKTGSRFNFGRIDYQDYRAGFLCGYNDGFIVCMGQFACFIDIGNKLVSWYHITPGTFGSLIDIRGTLKEQDGTDIFMMAGYACIKNGDNGTEAPSGGDDLLAVISGRIQGPPKMSPVLRAIIFATNSVFEQFYVAVNNKKKTNTLGKTATQLPTIGTSSWSSTSDADKISEAAFKSYDIPFAIRGDEMTVEIAIAGYPAVVPEVIDVIYKGPGKERPTR